VSSSVPDCGYVKIRYWCVIGTLGYVKECAMFGGTVRNGPPTRYAKKHSKVGPYPSSRHARWSLSWSRGVKKSNEYSFRWISTISYSYINHINAMKMQQLFSN
jgi:hypothetical protein